MAYLRKVPEWVGWKASDQYTRGVSDVVGCYKGFFVAIEIKRKGQNPTELQWSFIHRIRKVGGYADVARSVEDVQRFLAWVDQDIQLRVKI